MADPFSWTAIAAYASVAAAGIGTYATVQQGRAANAAAQAQADLYARNSRVAQNNATAEIATQKDTAKRMTSAQERLLGAQAAAAASSGLRLNGSVLDVMSDSALQSQLEIGDTIRESNNRASAILQQSSDFTAQAGMSRAAGANAKTSAYWGAGGTLLSGAGRSAEIYASKE